MVGEPGSVTSERIDYDVRSIYARSPDSSSIMIFRFASRMRHSEPESPRKAAGERSVEEGRQDRERRWGPG